MKYLIAIDSDGTIRHSDGSISDKTKQVVKKVIEKGNIVVMCTARPRYHTLDISKQLGISDYLISSNGTEVFDNINEKIIYSSYIPAKICKDIYNDSVNNDIRCVFVSDNTEYATKFIRNDSQVLLTSENALELLNNNIKQIMIIGTDKNKINEYKKIVENKYGVFINNSSKEDKEEIWFSIISNQASKGTALRQLADYLTIPIENTIAIGNDNNDLPMFEVAGISVAVSNATSEIKNIVDKVTLSNDEDGVAVFLENLLDNN